jgi:hypothetical protein
MMERLKRKCVSGSVKRLLCCGFRRTDKAMGQVYQCWWRICREINVFFSPGSNITCFTFYIHLWPTCWLPLVFSTSSSKPDLVGDTGLFFPKINYCGLLFYLLYTASLTHSWSWAHLEKLSIVQPLKNFPAFYGTRRFITVFTRALHWSLFRARSIQSIPSLPVSLRSILILSTHLCLGLPSGLLYTLYTITNCGAETLKIFKRGKVFQCYVCRCINSLKYSLSKTFLAARHNLGR